MRFVIPDIDKLIQQHQLKEVNNPKLINSAHLPGTLFSEDVFGPLGSDERYTKFGYIDLKGTYIHPALFDIIKRYSKLIYHALMGVKPAKVVNDKIVIDEAEGLSGIDFFKLIIENKDTLKNLNARIKAILDKYGDKVLIKKILVIPPAYRPIHYVNGRPVPDPINEFYVKLITLTSGSFENFPIVQETLWTLYETFKGLLAKKSGLIRGQILGKRLDFTARGVIISAPDIPSDSIGVPYIMLAQIAMPFVIHQLRTGFSMKFKKPMKQVLEELGVPLTMNALQQLLTKFSNELLQNQKLIDLIKEATEEAVKDKVVLVKRDPALHQYAWEAMKPIPVEGYVLRMSHGYLGAFGGDYDGDSVAGTNVTLYTRINDIWHKATVPIEKVMHLTNDDFAPVSEVS